MCLKYKYHSKMFPKVLPRLLCQVELKIRYQALFSISFLLIFGGAQPQPMGIKLKRGERLLKKVHLIKSGLSRSGGDFMPKSCGMRVKKRLEASRNLVAVPESVLNIIHYSLSN